MNDLSGRKANPLSKVPDTSSIDYSEVYKEKEKKQLRKRLRKTRNILFTGAAAFLAAGAVFWIMPETIFYFKDFVFYALLAVVFVLLGLYSNKHPYACLLTGLVLCIGFWAFEILQGTTDDILIGGSIQKLFITSLFVSGLHTSKEAELIRKELHFS